LSVIARISVDWKNDRVFEAAREGRPSILVDGDGKAAPSPPEALLAALASCVSVDVVDILAKRRTPVERFNVDVVGERVETVPRRFKHIALNFTIDGEGIDRVHADRAIDLALNKYCSVKDTLDPAMPIVWTLNLNGSAEPTSE
jgi:putative redox protein